MNTFLIIVIAVLVVFVLISLVRGIIAFMKSTKMDLDRDEGEGPSEMQLLQNKMMFNRIKYQAAAVIVVAILIAVAR